MTETNNHGEDQTFTKLDLLTIDTPYSQSGRHNSNRTYSNSFVQSGLTSWVRWHHGKKSKCVKFERNETGFHAEYEIEHECPCDNAGHKRA